MGTNVLTSVRLFKIFFWAILITQVLGVYIRAVFNIGPGNPLALYRDAIISLFLLFSFASVCLRPRKILLNKLDFLYFVLLIYCCFEILWTRHLTNNWFIGVFRFRLYWLVYLMYFSFVYFFRDYPYLIKSFLRLVKSVFVFIFLWAIVEFILINTNVISLEDYVSFLQRAVPGSGSSNYSNLWGVITLVRGYGILGHMQLAGVFSVVGLALFWPSLQKNGDFNSRAFILLGILASLFSLAKTAWILFFCVLLLMVLGYRKHRALFFTFTVAFFISMFLLNTKVKHIKDSTDAMIASVSNIYAASLKEFIGASLMIKLFGFGYEVHSGEIAVFGISKGSSASMTAGSELFFLSILRQWGIVGMVMYVLVFLALPAMAFFRSKNLLVQGMALAVIIAGISSIHYNAIFSSGINFITCFSLACLSVLYFDQEIKERFTN